MWMLKLKLRIVQIGCGSMSDRGSHRERLTRTLRHTTPAGFTSVPASVLPRAVNVHVHPRMGHVATPGADTYVQTRSTTDGAAHNRGEAGGTMGRNREPSLTPDQQEICINSLS
jgi:hypothetical protein